MQQRWLPFFVIAVLALIIFIFFWYRNQPIEIPVPEDDGGTTTLTEPTVTFINPSRGSATAKVTIVEFGDFECEACKTLADTLEVVLKSYPDDVKLVWKNLPNESANEFATPAAIAAHCADRQGAFWAYYDLLFERQGYLSETQFVQIAQEIGLDLNTFQGCYESRDTLPIVKRDYEEGLALGLTSTPTLFVGDEIVIGAVTTQELLDLVANLLASQ